MEKPNPASPIIYLKPAAKIAELPKIANGSALLTDTSITKPKELVIRLLHQGTKAVLAGGSKAGKTWALLYLALCVATGRKFLGWNTTKGKVLFINLEVLTAFMTERLKALMHRLGITNCGELEFWNLRGKTGDPEALIAHIIKETEGKGYALIIIDPYYKLMNGNQRLRQEALPSSVNNWSG